MVLTVHGKELKTDNSCGKEVKHACLKQPTVSPTKTRFLPLKCAMDILNTMLFLKFLWKCSGEHNGYPGHKDDLKSVS